MELLIDIDQGGRHRHPRFYGKTEALGLTLSMIGVLTQDHCLHLGKVRQFKGSKEVPGIREDPMMLVLIADLLIKFLIVWLSELRTQGLKPSVLDHASSSRGK